MQFPRLTPLQARFAACLGTTILLALIYFSLHPSHLAYAAELDSAAGEDHNHHRIAWPVVGDAMFADYGLDWLEAEEQEQEGGEPIAAARGEGDDGLYEPLFPGALQRELRGRAPLDRVTLKSNTPSTLNVNPGETLVYVFEKTEGLAESGSARAALPTNVTGPGAALRRRGIKEEGSVEDEGHIEEEAFAEEEQMPGNGTILARRQASSRTVYLSINTCLQPILAAGKTGVPSQLLVYFSRNSNNQRPSAQANDGNLTLDQGFGAVAINAVSDNLYISVVAPALPDGTFTGPWNIEIAASADDYYHYYNDTTAFLWTVDTDSTSALLATYNLTSDDGSDPVVQKQRQQWLDTPPPFSVYVFNSSSPKIDGIRKSYCGLSKLSKDFMKIDTRITERGLGGNPKQQFYVQSLLPGSTYFSVLAYGSGAGNSATSVGGGGQVWRSQQFSTKSDGNCALIFDLPFCDSVAYAVPTNPTNASLANTTQLGLLYDTSAAALYKNFSLSLQQIPCNTTSTAQYSLTSTCTDCARDYKTWLCAVTIPRCTDFSDPSPFLAPRNLAQNWPNGSSPLSLPAFQLPNADTAASRLLTNSSRNPLIDSLIKPGPYKELLPCSELCFDLVRSCPTALGFRCPERGSLYGALELSYGAFDKDRIKAGEREGGFSVAGLGCNFLGVDWPALASQGPRLAVPRNAWLLGFWVLAVVTAVLGW